MKHIIGYLCFFVIIFSGVLRSPEIVGIWESDTDIIEFKGSGNCVVNGEKAGYRSICDGEVVLMESHRHRTVSYMMSFDKQSMYFDGRKYKKAGQSGIESSIMEFLL